MKKKQKQKDPFKIPSPKKLVKTGVALGILGLGVGILNKSIGGN